MDRDYLGKLGVDGRIILKWISRKSDRQMQIGFLWLRIGISGRDVMNTVMNFGFR
jgi:hypothetical protein